MHERRAYGWVSALKDMEVALCAMTMLSHVAGKQRQVRHIVGFHNARRKLRRELEQVHE